MSTFEQPYWSEWSEVIIGQLGLKRTARDEFHGSCPNCGGTDRFWISKHNDLVRVHCRQCNDFQAIQQKMNEDGCWPSLHPQDNVVSFSPKDEFPLYDPHVPYHTRKQVELIGARLEDNVVVVPIYNPKLEEVAQQTIAPDGAKRNTKGLDKSGGVFGLCGALPEDGIAYIAEGWATAASVALATSKCCIFALACHNLPLVCEKIAEIRPRLQIIVAADNDDAGIEAATKTGLRWAAPNQDGADWNDVWVRSGHVPIVEGLKRAKRPGALFQKMSEIKVVPPQWIIDGMFEADTLAIVFGGSGEGKTFVVADAAMCIATGTAYHGHAVEKGPVAYISGEGNAGFSRRIAAWCIHNGVDVDDALFFKSMTGVTLAADAIDDIIRELDAIRGSVGDLKLIVFDTLDRSISGVEDDNSDVKQYLDFCDQIRTEFQCTVMVVAHVGHAARDRAKGSTKLRDRMDSSYIVKAVGDHCVEIKPTKMKDAPEPDALLFNKVTIDVPTSDGEVVSSLALELTAARTTGQAMTHDDKLDVVRQQFDLHSDFGNIPRTELKDHVAVELSCTQRTANRLIKDLIDRKVLKVDGKSIIEGDNYV